MPGPWRGRVARAGVLKIKHNQSQTRPRGHYFSMTLLPDNVLRCLSPDERHKLGKAGLTCDEAVGRAEVRNERKLQQQVAQFLDLKGVPYCWQRTDRKATGRPGTPDFIFCLKGRFCAIECKSARGHHTRMAKG